MERNWTKRKLLGLYQGDAETVRQWQSQYGRFIYTWLYYQLNKDESQAAALTAQILSQSLRELSAFDPEQITMYLWLKDAASGRLQAALTQSGLKVQRPWAWSEISAGILDSVRRIRNEALAPEVPGYGPIMEMVQAALADLSEQDRDLLIRRYTRLDAPDRIAAELNLSPDKVNQQLYLARHAFRRGLFFLMQSSNPDVTEPPVSGGTELFESNLEMLFRSVNAAAGMSSDSAEQIKRAVLQTASEVAQNPTLPVAAAHNRKALKAALLAGGMLVFAALILLVAHRAPQSAAPSEDTAPPQVAGSDTASQRPQTPNDLEELKRVFEIGVRGDIAGLLNVLNTGSFMAQMTAAHYLGQLADESAIEPLLEAQTRWYADGPLENAFARAVVDILSRITAFPEQEPVAVETAPPAEPIAQTPEPEFDIRPRLGGRIVDFSGLPLAGVQVALHEDGPGQAASSPLEGFSTVTDIDGRYTFQALAEGMFIVVARDPQGRMAETRRMVWLSKGAPSMLDFGGSASVSGTILIDSAPLAGQMLLLSDRFGNPPAGVFTAEMQTDAQGGFIFTGVPAGQYGLFSRYTANRWTLLAQLEVAAADMTAVFDQPTVSLVVQTDDLPEPLRVVAASLRYSPDSADVLAEWTAVRTEIDTVFEINRVIPGVYTLCVDFSNGVRILRDVVVSAQPEQHIFIEDVPFGTAGLAGQFLASWPEGLTLECAAPPMRISVMPEEDGRYELHDLPAATYSLGVSVNGTFVAYLDFGLFEEQPVEYDLNPVQLAAGRSPLYVYVADAQGRGLSGGQVWLSGEGGLYVAYPFGRGYFAAAPAGLYTLIATFPGYPAVEQSLTLPASTVQAPPSKANIRYLRLDR